MRAAMAGGWLYVCLTGMLMVAGFALAQEVQDPTPEMIRKAMMPTVDTVGDNAPVIKVRIVKDKVAVGDEVTVYAELHNEGTRHLVVYMPGLTGQVAFQGDPARERVAPPGWQRTANGDEREDYVVLAPGDYYGRVHTMPAPDVGKVSFVVTYENRKGGEHLGVHTWTGKTAPVKSQEVTIVPAGK